MSRLGSSTLSVCLLITLGFAYSLLGAPLPPILTPAGGYYKSPPGVGMKVGMNSPAAAGVTIYYNVNSTMSPIPPNGTAFSGPITLQAGTSTVQAVAYDGSSYSPVTSAAFNVSSTTTLPLPVITPNGGNYVAGNSTMVSITAAPGATIYYTQDGSAPTAKSTQYNNTPFQISSAEIISAIAVENGFVTSGVATDAFNFASSKACLRPTFTGAGVGWKTVTITAKTPNSVIRYTTDGTTPTADSPALVPTSLNPTMATKIIGKTTTLMLRAFAPGYADSDVTSGTFTVNASPTKPDMVQAGVTPSNTAADNTQNLQTLLGSLQNGTGGAYLAFPKGTYNFNDPIINAKHGLQPTNINNLVIDGQGSTFVFHSPSDVAQFQFSNCNNVTIENLTLDVSPAPASPATVTESDPAEYDCLLDPLFFAADVAGPPNNQVGIAEALQYDPVQRAVWPGGDILGYGKTNLPVTSLGTQKVRIDMLSGMTNSLSKGEYMDLHQYTYDAITLNFQNCDGVNIDNVVVLGSYGMGITAGNCADISLDQVDLLAANGRLNSSAADGTHFTSCRGLISYLDCSIANAGDDSMNVQGSFYPISSVLNATSITIENLDNNGNTPDIQPGEEIEFVDSSAQQIGTAFVTGTSPSGNMETLYIAPSIPANTNTTCVVDSLSWVPSLSVNRCNFLNDRGSGVKAKTNNVVAQNSRFAELNPSPITIETSVHPGYYESKGAANVQILNNSLEHGNYVSRASGGAINVHADDVNKATAGAGAINNVVIADNTVRDMDSTGIYVSSTNNFDVLNNTLENTGIINSPQPVYPNGNYAVYVEQASNGRVEFNTGVQSNYLRFAYDSYLPYNNVQNSTSPYNIQPFAVNWTPSGAGGSFQLALNDQCEKANMPSGATVTVDLYKTGSGHYSSLTIPAGALTSPTNWDDGSLTVSSGTVSTGTLPNNGTFTIQVGMNNAGPIMSLLTPITANVGTGKRVIVGTIVMANGVPTFTSAQLNVKPTVSAFTQTGSNQFRIGYTWNVNDTVPAGCSTFAYIYDSNGNLIQDISGSDNTPSPQTWGFESTVVSTPQTVNLTTPIPSAGSSASYYIVAGLKTSSGAMLQLSGDPFPGAAPQPIKTGMLTTGDGPVAPIGSANTSNVTIDASNTGFGM